MGTYDDEIELAQELLADSGSPLTITRRVKGVPGVGDRPATPPVVIVATCVGVVLNLKLKQRGADGLEPGSLLQSSERVVYIAGGGITMTATGGAPPAEFQPTSEDQLLIQGRRFTVVSNDPLSPDGGPFILHRTIVRT